MSTEPPTAGLDPDLARLRLLADALPIFILYVGRDLGYRYCNRALAEWLGSGEAAQPGRHVAGLIGGEAFALLQPSMEQAFGGQATVYEGWTPHRTGSRYIRATVVPDRGSDVKTGLVIVIEDLTGRVRAAEYLRHSEERFQVLFNRAAVGIAQATVPDGLLLTANQALVDITGYGVDELVGKCFLNFVHPADRAASRADYERIRDGEVNTLEAEKRLVRKDGRVTWVHSTATAVPDPIGPRIAVLTVQDITGRKEAERQLKDQANLLEITQDAIFTWEFERPRLIYWNRAAEIMYGYLRAEAVGRHPQELLKTKLADGSRAEKFRSELVRKGEWSGELLHTTATGQIVTVESRLVLFRRPDGTELVVESTRDVTERKRIEDELRRSNTDLLQFAYAVSHDLREPLRMMASFSQLLERQYGTSLDGPALEYIGFIVNGARRMDILLRDLLVYSRVGNNEEAPGSVSPSDAVETALANLSGLIAETQASIAVDDMPHVRAHHVHVVQLFQNLIGNALQYRAPDRPPRVAITARKSKSWCIFSVSDNGMGIARDRWEFVFGMFKRLHAPSQDRTGLGLALCRRIVESYGGKIWVESEAGIGSTFHFVLPADTTG